MKKIIVNVEKNQTFSIKVGDTATITGISGSVTIEDTTLPNQTKTSDSRPQYFSEFMGYSVADWIKLRDYLLEKTNKMSPGAILTELKARGI